MQNWFKTLIMASAMGCLICSSASAYSNKYKMAWELKGFIEEDDKAATPQEYTAGKSAKFSIIGQSDEDLLVVFFTDKKSVQVSVPDSVVAGKVYSISRTEMPAYRYRYHNGITYGALVVPFKMRLNDKTLSGQASIGPFWGWRWGNVGDGAVTLFATTGLTTISISDVNSSETENRLGLTAGVGLVATTAEGFQIGLIYGIDHLGDKDEPGWRYEDRPWVSFSIGFGFLGD